MSQIRRKKIDFHLPTIKVQINSGDSRGCWGFINCDFFSIFIQGAVFKKCILIMRGWFSFLHIKSHYFTADMKELCKFF